jgi:uncharacterized protein (TIGR02598 family)
MKVPNLSGQRGKTRGFSLAEVVIALGVITIGFVAVLAVLPASLQTGHSAQDETRAGHIAQSIFANLVAQAPSQFNSVRFLLSDGVTQFPSIGSPAIDLTAIIPQSYTLYAGNDGQLINSASNATYAITIYTNNTVAGFTDPASANAVTVRVAWPANAPVANQTFRDYVRIVSKF